MKDHRNSDRFAGTGFTVTILNESKTREYIETLEEYYIEYYDSFQNGLNETKSGKGWGHNSTNFTTLGMKFSKEQRKKMSESHKARNAKMTPEERSAVSKKAWINGGEEYRKRQSETRKGKRLKPPKLTDQQVADIRAEYAAEKDKIEQDLIPINLERNKRNSGWKNITPHSVFADSCCKKYGVSKKLIENIILWKSRTKILPSIYKS